MLKTPEKHIAIHKTCGDAMGYGLVALSSISNNTVVLEYIGERRGKDDNNIVHKNTDDVYSYQTISGEHIDSRNYGNLLRFACHLPDNPPFVGKKAKLSNSHVKEFMCPDNKMHAFLITKESIEPGEELGWDYGHSYWYNHDHGPMYLDPESGLCFEKDTEEIDIERYSNEINECETSLSNPLWTQDALSNLTNALLLRSYMYYVSRRYSESIQDSKSVLEVEPLSVKNKRTAFKILDLAYNRMSLEYIPNEHGENYLQLYNKLSHLNLDVKRTALWHTVNEKDTTTAELLLSRGVSTNVLINGYSVLHEAIFNNDKNMVSLLLNYGVSHDTKTLNSLGLTALFISIREKHYDIATLLLEKGAEPNALFDDGHSALYHTSYEGDETGTRLLLDYNANPNIQTLNKQGYTPLIIAIQRHNNGVVDLLLENGAEPDKKGFNGISPFCMGYHADNQEAQNILIGHGVEPEDCGPYRGSFTR